MPGDEGGVADVGWEGGVGGRVVRDGTDVGGTTILEGKEEEEREEEGEVGRDGEGGRGKEKIKREK